MGSCNTSTNCNPCGPDFNAINQLATKTAVYARQAKTSADNAENAWLEFNTLYLGAFAVAPTVDNEGDPLQTGALYWNSVSNTLFTWNGSAWVTATNFNEFTPFLATGTTTARNLVTREVDVINVKDFGAVGDGVTNDTAAFQAAYNAANDGSVIFVPSGSYLITSSLGVTKNVVWVIYGKAAGPTAPYFNQGYIKGTIRQFDGAKTLSYEDGDLITNPINGANWAIPFSLDFTSSQGRCAVTGFGNNNKDPNRGCIGVSGFVINSQPDKTSWGMYSDLQLESSATNSWVHGLEIAAKNKGLDKASNPYLKAGGVLGVWLAGGGDPTYGGNPTNPSNSGIDFIKNGHTWNRGIIFHNTSLTGCDGINGVGSAILFAKGHQIEWWASGGTSPSSYIRGDMTAGAAKQSLSFENGGIYFNQDSGSGQNRAFEIANPNNSLCGISIFPNPSEADGPTVSAIGSGSAINIDLNFRAKGNGYIKFGTRIATADAPISGYIEIKDSLGNVRKLAVIS